MSRLDEIRERHAQRPRKPLPEGASSQAVVNRGLLGEIDYLLALHEKALARIADLRKAARYHNKAFSKEVLDRDDAAAQEMEE